MAMNTMTVMMLVQTKVGDGGDFDGDDVVDGKGGVRVVIGLGVSRRSSSGTSEC